MTRFGGMGGITNGREFDPEDLFEAAVMSAMGEELRKCEPARCWYPKHVNLANELYAAITNQDWIHENGDTASYSFRAAGDLIAAVRGEGNYLDWYCSAAEGQVSERVRELMAREGWRPTE